MGELCAWKRGFRHKFEMSESGDDCGCGSWGGGGKWTRGLSPKAVFGCQKGM